MIKMRLRIPFVGFLFTLLAFIATLVALSMYLNLYSVAGYPTNWWTVLFSALPALFLAVILVNSILLADDPFFMIVFYVAAAFMLIFGGIAMLQPAISEIAFVWGSPDLAMGDNAIRVFISENAINTTVWYVVAAVFTIVGAFTPNMLMRNDERRNTRVEKAVKTLYKYNKQVNNIITSANLDMRFNPIPGAPPENKEQSLDEKTDANIDFARALFTRIEYLTKNVREVAADSSAAVPVVEQLENIVEKSKRVLLGAGLSDVCGDSNQSDVEQEQPQIGEEVNNG